MINVFEKLKERLYRRRESYRRVFLGNEDGLWVLENIRRICGADQPSLRWGTHAADPIASAYAAGRQEVYAKIIAIMAINTQEIINIREKEYHE